MDDKSTKLTALIIASLGSFITPFMISSINIALPGIGKEFQTDAVLLSWVATAYLLAAAVSLVPFGKLADIYGRKKVYMIGMSLFTFTSFLSAVSISAPMLIVFRIFQGALKNAEKFWGSLWPQFTSACPAVLFLEGF
jgi:MFS family permease